MDNPQTMKCSWLAKVIPALLIVVGSAFLYLWLGCDSGWYVTPRLPGNDGRPKNIAPKTQSPALAGKLEVIAHPEPVKPSSLPGSWPRFRGADFDGISKDPVKLARTWLAEGPRVIWSLEVGEGYASPAIHSGRVYLIDYDRAAQADAIRCFSLDNGAEFWRYSYPVKVKRNHGMSRTIPAVTDRFVVTMGPLCHVACLDATSGDLKWFLDLVAEYGAEVPLWYAGQCPLIDNDRAILAPGGNALLMAVDCQTGKVIWETPNPKKWKMTHSSIMPAVIGGVRMYLYCSGGGALGVSAEDGKVLWEDPEWTVRTNVPSPVPLGDGRIFLTAGYNRGCRMISVQKDGDSFAVEKMYELPAEEFGAEQQTPIWFQNHLFAVRAADEQLICMNPQGKILWASGSAVKFGLGPFALADGLIFALEDRGMLRLAEATTDGYKQLAEAQVLTGRDAWGPMAFASGRLIVRDETRMICLDVSEAVK